MELHAGLLIIVPNAVPDLQRALFRAALRFAQGRDLMNSVIQEALRYHGMEAQPFLCSRALPWAPARGTAGMEAIRPRV